MKKQLVYIIVLNWNGWTDTLNCLVSLCGLNYDDYRIVVVDNGSSDNSCLLIRGAFPHITLLETGINLGFSAGNNVGISFALENGADYIWLLNNDTIVFPDTLSEMVSVAEEDQNIGAIGSVIYDMSDRNQVQAWGGGRISFLLGLSKHVTVPAHLDYLTAASILIPRAVFESVGLWNEKYFLCWEDVEFSFRLRKAGYRLAVAEKSRVLHKVSASTRKNQFLRDSYDVESLIIFFKQYAPVPTFTITIGLLGKIFKRAILFQFSRMKSIRFGLQQAMRRYDK